MTSPEATDAPPASASASASVGYSQEEKEDAVQSFWWRKPIECMFPDKLYDGQFQNPSTERIYDYDDYVMKTPDPFAVLRDEIVYYPPDDDKAVYGIFVPGLGQAESTACRRSRRYADRLETGVANLNNGSFLKKNPLLGAINPALDWIDAAVHFVGLSGSPVIRNAAEFVLYAMEKERAINVSADSHGTILLGRALREAKKEFLRREAAGCVLPFSDRKSELEERWETKSREYVNVVLFGNGYRNWVVGPKYIFVNIDTDPLTTAVGTTPEYAERKGRDDMAFLSFESIFKKGNFEAHNMMYTIELLRETFVRNGLAVGDFPALYAKLQEGGVERDRPSGAGAIKLVTAEEAKARDFPWPEDMPEYTWTKDFKDYLPFAPVKEEE